MKGILFKPWKIKAIAEDDREWMTRRLGGLKEINKEPDKWTCNGWAGSWQGFAFSDKSSATTSRIVKPRYQVGEVVYLKEAWRMSWYKFGNDRQIPYYRLGTGRENQKGIWKSPLFMPEWAARLFIKITDIRAERLQEITEEDAITEGIYRGGNYYSDNIHAAVDDTACSAFKRLWNSINKDYPWESNPWVFVYSFKRVEK